MNYTQPDKEDHVDKPEDWLFSALTFSFALDALIPEGHGIIVDLRGDAIDLYPNASRVIVYNDGFMMRILDGKERTDLKHGDMVKMIIENDIIN